MKTCSKCNIQFDDSKKFCTKCGSPLVSAQKIDTESAVSKEQINVPSPADNIQKDKKHFNRKTIFCIIAAVILLITAIILYKQLYSKNVPVASKTTEAPSKNKQAAMPSAGAVTQTAPANSALFATAKYPAQRGAVNDFANVIDQNNASKMEALAREVLQKTGTAVAVVTVPSIGEGEETGLYAKGLYRAWSMEKKGEYKGVLIFLAVKERKISIETGYGLKSILPDGLVGEIRDKYCIPQLKAGNFGQAFYDTMYRLSSYIAKDAHVELGKY